MIVYGYRRQVQHLTTATYLCGQCRNPTAHALRRAVTKLTLFFIPLFPIHSKHFTVCTFCGATNKLTKAEAQQVMAMQQSPAPQAPAPAPQFQPPAAAGRPELPPAPQQFGAPQQAQYHQPGLSSPDSGSLQQPPYPRQ